MNRRYAPGRKLATERYSSARPQTRDADLPRPKYCRPGARALLGDEEGAVCACAVHTHARGTGDSSAVLYSYCNVDLDHDLDQASSAASTFDEISSLLVALLAKSEDENYRRLAGGRMTMPHAMSALQHVDESACFIVASQHSARGGRGSPPRAPRAHRGSRDRHEVELA